MTAGNFLRASGLACILVLIVSCKSTLPREISKLGFVPLQPPRDKLQPGTLVVLRPLPGGHSGIRSICWPAQAFPGLVPPTTNNSATLVAKQHLEKTFSLGLDYLKRIKSDSKYSQVADISLTITDPLVVEYSSADLYEAISKRQSACNQSIADERADEEKVLTVVQVLRANVTYHITTDTRFSTTNVIPETLLKGLKVELGGSYVNTNDATISGSDMVWGILPDRIGVRTNSGAVVSTVVPGPKLSVAERKNLTRRVVTTAE